MNINENIGNYRKNAEKLRGYILNDGFDVKLEIVGRSLTIVFGWTLRGLTNGFL